MKRMLVAMAAGIYASALLWGDVGAGVALIVSALTFIVLLPRFVEVDPHDTTSVLDRMDGAGRMPASKEAWR